MLFLMLALAAGCDENVRPPDVTIAIVSPEDGMPISGRELVRVSAEPAAEVFGVEFWVDGSVHEERFDLDLAPPFESMLDTTRIADAQHHLRCVAIGRGGQTATTTVTVHVDNQDPLVDIVQPAAEDVVFVEDREIVVRIWATDGSGIDSVILTVDGDTQDDVTVGSDGMWEATVDLAPYEDRVGSASSELEIAATAIDLFGREATEVVSVPLAFRSRWHSALPSGAVAGSIAVSRDGSTAYVASSQGVVYALDMSTGAEICRSGTMGETFSGPTVSPDGRLVLFGSSTGMHAMTPAPGCAHLWTAREGELAQGSALLHPTSGSIYFSTRDGGLHAATRDGVVVWSRIDVGLVRSAPTFVAENNLVVVASDDGSLHAVALDASGGAIDGFAWSAATGASLEASATLQGGRVFVGSTDGALYAFNAADGSAAWAAPFVTGRMITSVPFVDVRGDIFFTSRDRNCYRLSPDGTAVWAYEVPSGIDYSGPVVDEETDLVVFGELGATGSDGSRHGVLHALDRESGEDGWTAELDGAISSTPTIVDGIVLIGTSLGQVHAFYISGEAARRELDP
jgi:outer membrane protein assembly factor BamB